MVESPGTALAIGVVDAQAIDTQLHKRLRELATSGKQDPAGFKPAEIEELCSAVLKMIPETDA